jgi:hypothetical protein
MKWHFFNHRFIQLAAAIACAAALNSRAANTHRYSFTEDASDSVGDADGTLMGDAFIDSGAVSLDGTSGTYVELQPNMITNYTSVSFDFWIDIGQMGNWGELYAFGDRDADGNGSHMLMFTPHSGASPNDFRMSYADTDPGFNHEFVVTQPGVLDDQGPIHITCVYDPPNHTMALYTNGLLAAANTNMGDFFSLTNIFNVHSWLGQSLYAPDAPVNGRIDEFRVFDNALNPLEVAGSQVSGPDTVGTDPGAVSALHITSRDQMPRGSVANAALTADFAGIQGVNLLGIPIPGITFTSSDTNIVQVTSAGIITAGNLGSATITASFQGKTATQNITVISGLPAVLQHRYTFTADASDSVGTANGTLMNSATIDNGAVVLNGQDGYVDLPNDMLTNYESITMEVWVTDNGSANWARIWDFGNSSGGEDFQGGGLQFTFLALPSGGGTLLGTYAPLAGPQQSVEWIGGRPPVGQENHIVWTSDAAFHVAKLYVNGALVGINTNFTDTPKSIGPTFNDWLGRSQYNDPFFNGAIDEFRIYDGALTPMQVALDAASGHDTTVTNAGNLLSAQLTLGTNRVVFGGFDTQITLLGNFENLTNVNLTTLEGATFQSSNTNVVKVSPTGRLTATSLGTATITATYGGKTATFDVTTVTPVGYVPPTLIHRYSFNEAAGSTTVKDSAGTADGTIIGQGAVFGGGQLTMPGGTSSSADPSTIAAYVDLPNGIISVLTNVTFEAWVTWQGSGPWQRIFDFGTSASGEDFSDGNGNYIFLTPQGDVDLHFSVRDPATGGEPAPINAPTVMPANQEMLITVTYDHIANIARLYTNAVLVGSGAAPVDLTTIVDVNNWLGRSQWPDGIFQGKYDEFRIWNGALLPDEVAAHYAAGPDSLTPVTQPQLTVAQSGSNITISWSAADPGFVLQSTAQLGPNAQWTPVAATPVVNNGVNTVMVPATQNAQFFRVAK